jgi:hypothetical protein
MKYILSSRQFESLESGSNTDLKSYLISYGIPVDEWGKGYAKTIWHLEKEIESEECSLVEDNGTLVREIEFVMCEIFYKGLKLKEEKQIFKDRRERTRVKESSMSEKMKIGEDPLNSLIRGIEEELGVDVREDQLISDGIIKREDVSGSFPGLTTRYLGHKYSCTFDESQYNPEGYVEHQKDKSTYFIWE